MNGKEMVSCRQSVAGRSGSRQSGAYRALGQEENVDREMVGAICSPAELSKCVGVVVTSVVPRLLPIGTRGPRCRSATESRSKWYYKILLHSNKSPRTTPIAS